jgi:RNA polymerase sigma-70 factor (ECF subfamily)
MADELEPASASELLRRAAAGDSSALGQALEPYRKRLRRMIALRIDRRLQGRVDPSDIVQEAYIDAARRIGEYTANSQVPFYLWLRVLAGQRLVDEYRRHLGTQARDVAREFTLFHGTMPEPTSAALAAQLLGRWTTPSEAAMRAERRLRLQAALNQMDRIDREILALRHFEQMTNGEVAAALMLDKSAASKRYVRALTRLKDILSGMPGASDEQ